MGAFPCPAPRQWAKLLGVVWLVSRRHPHRRHTHRANVARKDNAHWTPLHYAAINAQTKCAALLIEKGTHAHETVAGRT